MKKIVFLSIALFVLAGCSNEMNDGIDRVGSKLDVRADIDQITSRVTGLAWDKGDRIGLSYNPNQETGLDNVLYTTTEGDGKFSTEAMVYILGAGEKTYTAYYPYSETVSAEAAVITFTEPVDFMWASATASREKPVANFLFAHKMAKLSLTITNKTNPDAASGGTSVTVRGMAVGGTFNTLTGEVVASTETGELKSDVVLGAKISFIIPVQTVSAEGLQLILLHNGKAFSGKIAATEFAAGNEYHYTVDIPDTEPAASLTVSSDTITDWTPNEGGDVTVGEEELPKEPNVLEVGDFLLKDGTVIDKDDRDFEELKAQVAGVVYLVGTAQPSTLYGYAASQDVLLTECPTAVNGLAIAINDANDGVPARFANAKYDFGGWYKDEANAVEAANYIATNLNLTKPGTEMLGYNNTKVMQKIASLLDTAETNTTGIAETLDLVAAYNTANAVTAASEWYIPSFAEVKAVADNYDVVAASIVKAGGALTQFTELAADSKDVLRPVTDNYYWTSDLRGSQNNWTSLCSTVTDESGLYQTRNSNSFKGYFRLSIVF